MSPPSHLTNGVVRLVDFDILQSCSISPTFCSVASLPLESTPLSFLGWYVNGVGPQPPPAATTTTVRRQGPPVGRRARGTWTATLDYVQMTLHLGAMLLGIQDGQNEYARDKRPDLLVLHSASCSATLQRSRPKPQQPDLFAPRYASMLYICQLRVLHFTSTALRAASASRATASAPPFCTSDQLGIMPQGRHTGIDNLDNR